MKNFFIAAVLALVAMSAQGCSGQKKPANSALNGKWAIEFNTRDLGLVRSFMSFEFGDSNFIAYTRKGADRDILGVWKSALARLFTKDFKNGSLINITDGKTRQSGDTLLLSGIFRAASGNYYFRGAICSGTLQARLLSGKMEQKGSISGSRAIPPGALADYPALVRNALAVTRDKIYSRVVLDTKVWASFEKDLQQVALKVQDDIEMEFAFYYYAAKLPFSHYALLRPATPLIQKSDSSPPEKQVTLLEKTPATLYMKIESFSGSAAEMDSVFSVIIGRGAKNLVVDLRGNPGGSVAAGMKFATCVSQNIFYGGVFLTQKWFEKNAAPPPVKDYDKLPVFTAANFDLLISGIHGQQGLCLKIVPEKTTYAGRLFILTNKATASTCEPIVYGLKQNKRAVIVGEKTAGVMLNGEFFELDSGFSIMLPTADYYAADGYHIDQKGVEPSVSVEETKALEYVIENLIGK